MVASIVDGFRGEFDVGQIHAGLGVGPFDYGAEAEVAVRLQRVGGIAQRTQPGDIAIEPGRIVVVDRISRSVGDRGQPTVIGPAGHLAVGVLHPTMGQVTGEAGEKKSSLDNCLKLLAGVQEQIRFADTKSAFVFAINTLMFGFVVNSVITLKRALALNPVPAAGWVGLVALVLFGVCAVGAVGMLIYTVMSRFGEKAPKCHIFFGHIATQYGHDFEKYFTDIMAMSEDDWLKEVCTQVLETSHIALAKHKMVRYAGFLTIAGLACWVVAVFTISLIP